MYAAYHRWKIVAVIIVVLTVCGCGTTRLMNIPTVLDPPRIPLHVGVYVSSNVRLQTKTVGIVTFELGKVAESVLNDQCSRAFLSVIPLEHFPWSDSEAGQIDVAIVIDQPIRLEGWVSGLTQWTVKGGATVSVYTPAGKLLKQITEDDSMKLNVSLPPNNELVRQKSYEGQRIMTHAVLSRCLSQISSLDIAPTVAAKPPSKSMTAGKPVHAVITDQQPAETYDVDLGPGNRYAVVIGINTYDSEHIPPLKYAIDDAQAIYEFLVNHAGFPQDNVILLLGKDATQRNIRSALGTFLARNALRNDTVIIFYAGHGAPETDYTRNSPDGYVKYIVQYDANPDDLFATAIPMSEISTYFARTESERLIFFNDACYSGASGGRSFMMGNFRGIQIVDPIKELAKGKGRVIITAGGPNEPVIEDSTIGHGIFTYYLLKGLSGNATDKNGQVTVHSLYRYLSEQITRKSKQLGGNQHPVMKGETQGDIVLVPAKK